MTDWSHLVRPGNRAVIEALLQGPLTLSELAGAVKLAKPSLLRHVKSLSELGVLTVEEHRTKTGREARYRLEGGSLHIDVRPEAHAIISWATSGAVDHDFPLASQVPDEAARKEVLGHLGALRARLAADDLWDGVFIILFGSAARGRLTWKSDLDYLFVYDEAGLDRLREAVEDCFAIVAEELAHPARPQYSTRVAFRAGKRTVDREAKKDGLVLHDPWGDDALWTQVERYRGFRI